MVIAGKQKRLKDSYMRVLRFNPAHPMEMAKIYVFWITKNYRKLMACLHCQGEPFSTHESPLKGETFVTRKKSQWLQQRYALGMQDVVYREIWKLLRIVSCQRLCKSHVAWMLQQEPEDFVIAQAKPQGS